MSETDSQTLQSQAEQLNTLIAWHQNQATGIQAIINYHKSMVLHYESKADGNPEYAKSMHQSFVQGLENTLTYHTATISHMTSNIDEILSELTQISE